MKDELTPEERAALEARASLPAASADPDGRWYRARLEDADGHLRNAVDLQRADALAWALDAMIDAAQFERARSVLRSKVAKLLPPLVLKGARDRIKQYSAAINLADDHECSCKREKATIKDNYARDIEVELNRRHVIGKMWNPSLNRVVPVYRYTCCGKLNATLVVPERQVELHSARFQLRNQISKKAALKDIHNLASGFSDDRLLKVGE